MPKLPENLQYAIVVAHRFEIQQQGRKAVYPQRRSPP
jgi:hypothetical protein